MRKQNMKNDTELQLRVIEELKGEMNASNAAHIGVAVKDGVVTLSGCVRCFPEKWAAERAVKRVKGVKAMAEDIQVILPGSVERSDTEIAYAAETALEWNTMVPQDKVKIIVEKGTIALEGQVDSYWQKIAAQDSLRCLTGIEGVDNRMTIKQTEFPEITAEIEKSFIRNAQIDAGQIHVEVLNNHVTLYGNVRSWAEREEAEKATWAASGVTKVTNNIIVA